MAVEAKLLKVYFDLVPKPTFSGFLKRHNKQIEDISVYVVKDAAIELERHWVHCYNTMIQIRRPESDMKSR